MTMNNFGILSGCLHRYIETTFSPKTRITTFSALEQPRIVVGKRKAQADLGEQDSTRSQSVHVSTCWIILRAIKRGKDESIKNLQPPFKDRCCSKCNPSLYSGARASDTIQQTSMASKASPSRKRRPPDSSWIISPKKNRGRADSCVSGTSAASGSGRSSRASSVPRMPIGFYRLPQEAVEEFRTRLWTWRDQEFSEREEEEFFLTKNDVLSIRTHSMVVGEARRWLLSESGFRTRKRNQIKLKLKLSMTHHGKVKNGNNDVFRSHPQSQLAQGITQMDLQER
jgi:hypothetical protein